MVAALRAKAFICHEGINHTSPGNICYQGLIRPRVWRKRLHRHAAVDHDDLPGDVAGFVGGEEGGRMGDVFRLAEVGQGDAGEQGLSGFFGNGVGHVRGDESGRNGVDGHLAAGNLLSHGLGEADDTGFGGRVVALAYVAGEAYDGGNVDDAAGGTLHEGALQGFHEEEYALEVGGENGIPVAFLHAHEQTVLGDAGVVDQDVDGGVFGQDVLDAGFHGGGIGHIAGECLTGVGELGIDGFCGAAAGVGIAGNEDDLGALGSKAAGDGLADAATGTCNNGGFTCESVHSAVILPDAQVHGKLKRQYRGNWMSASSDEDSTLFNGSVGPARSCHILPARSDRWGR